MRFDLYPTLSASPVQFAVHQDTKSFPVKLPSSQTDPHLLCCTGLLGSRTLEIQLLGFGFVFQIAEEEPQNFKVSIKFQSLHF